jgi:hypothetical protein
VPRRELRGVQRRRRAASHVPTGDAAPAEKPRADPRRP